MNNDNDQFCFGDNETYGIPAVEVKSKMFKITYEQLKDFACEFYGKVLENQLVTAGGEDEMSDSKWIVAFLPDLKNSGPDTFSCRRSFKNALECYRIAKENNTNN